MILSSSHHDLTLSTWDLTVLWSLTATRLWGKSSVTVTPHALPPSHICGSPSATLHLSFSQITT